MSSAMSSVGTPGSASKVSWKSAVSSAAGTVSGSAGASAGSSDKTANGSAGGSRTVASAGSTGASACDGFSTCSSYGCDTIGSHLHWLMLRGRTMRPPIGTDGHPNTAKTIFPKATSSSETIAMITTTNTSTTEK